MATDKEERLHKIINELSEDYEKVYNEREALKNTISKIPLNVLLKYSPIET